MSKDGNIDLNGWGDPEEEELSEEPEEYFVPVRPVIVHEHIRWIEDD